MNNSFIGISEDIRNDLFISLVVAGFFIFLGSAESIFAIGTPKAIPFVAQMAMIDQIIVVCIIAPLIEEAFFRFFLFGVLNDTFKNYTTAVRLGMSTLIVSAAFAIFHYGFYGIALQTAYLGAFLFSVVACGLMVWRQSQLPGTILHVVINSAILWGIFVMV